MSNIQPKYTGSCLLCHDFVGPPFLVCANCAIEIDEALRENEGMDKADRWKNKDNENKD